MAAGVVRIRETIFQCLSDIELNSPELEQKALKTLASITKVSPQNRNLLVQLDGALSTLLALSKSSSSFTTQMLSLSILFNLSLNPNLKPFLAADMENITHLNSLLLFPESSRLAASFVCSLAMLDKNKCRFGVSGTIQVLVKAVSGPRTTASHHLLSSLAELVQFHGNCTVAVRSGAVPVLIEIVGGTNSEDDLAGTSLVILGLLARFEEGLSALRKVDRIVSRMLDVLKGRCMLSKEGACEILLRLFDESDGCVGDALRLPEFDSVLADLSVRGSGRAREKAGLLMKKMLDCNFVEDSNPNLFLEWQ